MVNPIQEHFEKYLVTYIGENITYNGKEIKAIVSRNTTTRDSYVDGTSNLETINFRFSTKNISPQIADIIVCDGKTYQVSDILSDCATSGIALVQAVAKKNVEKSSPVYRRK